MTLTFNWLQRYLKSGVDITNRTPYSLIEPVRPGRVVCSVEMRGCMGDVRHDERWGKVVQVEVRDGANFRALFAKVQFFLDKKEEWLVASELRDRGDYLEHQY